MSANQSLRSVCNKQRLRGTAVILRLRGRRGRRLALKTRQNIARRALDMFAAVLQKQQIYNTSRFVSTCHRVDRYYSKGVNVLASFPNSGRAAGENKVHRRPPV